jgi:hypothetical protein
MKLVKDAASAWKWYSVQILAIIAILQAMWMNLDPEIIAMLPEDVKYWIVIVLSLLGVVGRLISQNGDKDN